MFTFNPWFCCCKGGSGQNSPPHARDSGVAIGKAVEEELGKRQGQRTDLGSEGQEGLFGEELRQNFAEVEPGKRTDEIAAKKAGFGSEFTYRQAKAVTEKATPELVAAMDQGTIAISTAAKLAGQTLRPQINGGGGGGKLSPLGDKTGCCRKDYSRLSP